MHSAKLNVQLLISSLAYWGVQDVVISPGSRNAPLVLEFSENPKFNCYSVVDERSAGFFALGLAQQTHKPTVLCCTSGSAVANYYPAITEAFYQNIPLLVISADRPQAYVDRFMGQTIRQENLFQNHIKESISLNDNEGTEELRQQFLSIKKVLSICELEQGPVHINFHLTEPLYKTVEEASIEIDSIQKAFKECKELDFEDLKSQWNSYDKKMILCGMLPPDSHLQKAIYRFAEDQNAVILSESISNLSHPNIFPHIDRLLFSEDSKSFEKYAPEIVLSIGQNLVSKIIKQLIGATHLKAHWHLDEYWKADTFFQLTDYFQQDKTEFLTQLYSSQKPSDYYKSWKALQGKKFKIQENTLEETPFSDLKVYEFLSEAIPSEFSIQWGNSSAVRYSQLFDFSQTVSQYSNRGTSGIEGSIATAIGANVATEKPTILITGDIAFFYESNSLWNEYIRDDFKVIIVNNQGGEIFNFIPGPSNVPQKNNFLTTTHHRNAQGIASEFGFAYFEASDENGLKSEFQKFIQLPKKAILEINTSGIDNSRYLKQFLGA